MDERRDRPTTGTLDPGCDAGSGDRLHEERARQILARAAALDAERSSEIEVDQLREAAAGAGISPAAFDQALREEFHRSSDGRLDATAIRAPGSAKVARYAALIRDLLGDDVQVVVVEDRIEGRDEDGVCVSISPSGGATAAIVAEGSLKRRLVVLALSAVPPTLFGLGLAADEEDAGIGMILGVLLTLILSMVGLFISHRREKKELEKKTDRVRRQLQRMLGPASDDT